jgi:hypothetical protein
MFLFVVGTQASVQALVLVCWLSLPSCHPINTQDLFATTPMTGNKPAQLTTWPQSSVGLRLSWHLAGIRLMRFSLIRIKFFPSHTTILL